MSLRSSAGELCGDAPLTRPDKVRYLAHGIGEIAAALVGFRPAAPLARVDPADPATATRIGEGATPFRVYSSAWLAAGVAGRAPGVVLDLGCGAGGLARFFGSAWSYLGLDLTPKPGWSAPAAGARFVAASAESVPLAAGAVDAVVSSSALEHIDSFAAALRETRRVLKPHGVALHAVPGPWSLLLYLFHGFRRFTPAQLADAARAAGFAACRVERFGGLASFALHAAFVTAPSLVLRRDLRQGAAAGLYARLLRVALALDRALPLFPVGYGVRCEAADPTPDATSGRVR